MNTRIISFLIILIMAFTMTACGDTNTNTQPTTAEEFCADRGGVDEYEDDGDATCEDGEEFEGDGDEAGEDEGGKSKKKKFKVKRKR